MHRKSVSGVLLVCVSFFLMSSNIHARNELIEAKAASIHAEVLTIDTHVDTPMKLLWPNFDLGQRHDPRITGSVTVHRVWMGENGSYGPSNDG